jgi:hypothetical protein
LQPRLEAIELALDLAPDLVPIEETQQRPPNQVGCSGKGACRCQSRHRPHRGSKRQIEMQADAQMAAVRAQARGGSRPMRCIDHHAGGGEALGRGQLADGARDTLGHGIVVGTQDDHALGPPNF